MATETRILGIESSCDDTSAAVVADGTRVLASIVSSQIDVHRRFGGVVPEVASRKHLEAMLPVLHECLGTAGLTWNDLDGVAATAGPGLLGPLLIGLSTAKAIAWAKGLPFIPVHHLEAHLTAAFLAAGRAPEYPFLGLIVSGGHANLVWAKGCRSYEVLGTTADDAPGELFDKVARHLQLGFPGGPVIQQTGRDGDPGRYPLPRPMVGKGPGFSFSGLKTAVMRVVQKEGDSINLADLCASLETAVAETFQAKVGEALQQTGAPRLVVAGGVAANQRLREAMQATAADRGAELLVPPIALCTDNAAMIAAHGHHIRKSCGPETLTANASANWPMGSDFPH